MPATIKRDRFFWTIALQTLVVNFFLGGFGPSQPLLRADQGTSLTIAGLHGTAMGIASILSGLTIPYLAHRFGRANAGWLGLIIFSFGLLALALVQPVQLTILAALVTGYGCSTVINSFVVSLNGHYGAMAPIAVAQANGVCLSRICSWHIHNWNYCSDRSRFLALRSCCNPSCCSLPLLLPSREECRELMCQQVMVHRAENSLPPSGSLGLDLLQLSQQSLQQHSGLQLS